MKLFGIDLVTHSNAKPVNVELKKAGKMNHSYSLEADNSGFSDVIFNDARFDTRYFFRDMSPEDIEDLRKGRAYLEFWLPVVDHDMNTGVSGNGKYYSKEDIEQGMDKHFVARMSTGGVSGELDHPALKMYSDSEKSQMNIQNNMNRISKIDEANAVWRVVGYKLVNNISFFKFRTSIENRRVVLDMLNGKAPSCSLRVLGNFSRDPNTGIWRGTDIRFVTIDYVDNPGFKIASLFQGAVDLIKSGTDSLKKVSFTNNQNISQNIEGFALESVTESLGLNPLEGEGYILNDAYIAIEEESDKKVITKSLQDHLDTMSIL